MKLMGTNQFLRLVLLSLAFAGKAHAASYLTPFAGGAFSGDTASWEWTYGVSPAFAGQRSVAGFAMDFGHTPHLLGTSAFGDNSVTTLMGNLVLISPGGHPRLYASAGGGLIKTSVQGVGGLFKVDSSDFGINAGAGFYAIGGGPVGLNADVRYFRALTDPVQNDQFDFALGKLHFWRAVAGLTLRF